MNNTIQLLQHLPKTEETAVEMRQLTGAILSQNLSPLGHPFLEVTTLVEFQQCFDNMVNNSSINEMDAAATKIINISKLKKYSFIEQNAIRCAAAFLKSSANLASLKRKRKAMKSRDAENGEFVTKLALNAIIEFNTGRDSLCPLKS
ncbi:hypothetical protein ACJ3XI_04160 [Litorimonas sp. RW-G-Af-16]|uniref:hypothetical protein n=1 Tax=Litorimonas sp. RW-G-Af-16 TaxID=3241168 RepID=UPI00390C915B